MNNKILHKRKQNYFLMKDASKYDICQIFMVNIVHFVFIRCLIDIFKNQVTNSRILFVQNFMK